MHYGVKSIVALTTVAALAVGCASAASSPTGPSAAGASSSLTADQVAGRWVLASIQTAGQPEQPVPDGASYDLALEEGRISTRADCNNCGGTLTVNRETVTIGPVLACTRAACPTMAFETAYVGVLAGESAVRIEGTSLTLTSPRGVLRFRR